VDKQFMSQGLEHGAEAAKPTIFEVEIIAQPVVQPTQKAREGAALQLKRGTRCAESTRKCT
jgi:hypothetical protein